MQLGWGILSCTRFDWNNDVSNNFIYLFWQFVADLLLADINYYYNIRFISIGFERQKAMPYLILHAKTVRY